MDGWDDSDKALQLGIHLTGIARTSYAELSPAIKTAYALLVKSLSNQFSPNGREAASKAELRNRRKKPEESFTDYA